MSDRSAYSEVDRVKTKLAIYLLVFVGLGCSTSASVASKTDLDQDPSSEAEISVVEPFSTAERAIEVEPDTTSQRSETMVGYYAWWMKGAWLDLDLEVYDRIIFFTTTPGSDGLMQTRNGWPHAWVSFLSRTDSLGIHVVPALALLEADSIKTLFGSETAIGNLVETAITLVEESKGAGVHLDIELFETVSDSLRDGFFQFTDSLATRMAADWPEAKLSIFAPAFDYDGLYDLARINPGFSQIMVQGYDLHWQTGPTAGPVATLKGWNGANWEEILSRYENAGISKDRIIMTVPYYGYEWPVKSPDPGSETRGEARIITYAAIDSVMHPQLQISIDERIADFGFQRDSVSTSPYYVFSDSSGYWQGWYEDEISLRLKYDFVQKNGLKGVATFPMGYDGGLLDAQLNAHFGRRRYPR
ncbi:MAG: glycosyl hydrolase family 18 protein [Bacteroidetes bacterium]|nr:glycosyl hydrolase family 18 protein [Bacteroidota bacterium]